MTNIKTEFVEKKGLKCLVLCSFSNDFLSNSTLKGKNRIKINASNGLKQSTKYFQNLQEEKSVLFI
ncbi:hypothetical protein D1164_22080 [Mariniphaga sediminis]|jgi:hypothetical protein|uniref:Uncharacterized protein n=1 Tax=Mariniphaga sediminis TaxID=1628158 RepID=A0A399CUI1_9BACT|nr:hypothetical protein D1164_22080 [Mariniphaga sediminis]